MTEPILAAEVLAEAWVVREAVASSLDALVPEAMAALLALYEKEVAALLALFPEGDVVIRRDGTVAGLRQAFCACSEAPAGKPDHPKAHHKLVPLSQEAE